MARVVYYRLTFDSVPGTDEDRFEWELDLIADDADVPASDIPGYSAPTPVSIIGGSEPVSVEWLSRDNPYEPILGSSVDLSFMVTDDTEYVDFNSYQELTWEVRIRRVLSGGTKELWWCGYIIPSDSYESITTTPYQVSYVATDGLGLISQQNYPVGADTSITETSDVSLIGIISEALRQTGNELPLYVKTGIENNDGDVLTNTSVSQFAFTDVDGSKRTDLRTIIEGTLDSFNSKLFQARGAWWIINSSTHGGTGTNESVSFEHYNFQGVKQTSNYTTSVRQFLGGDSSTLLPFNKDFGLYARPAAGSVQANVMETTPLNYVNNPFFDDVTPFGWTALDGSTFDFTRTSLNGRSISTEKHEKVDDLWFENTTGIEVDTSYPIKVDFDYFRDVLAGQTSYGTKIGVYIWLELPSNITGAKLVSNSLGLLAPLFGNSPITRETFSTRLVQWHFGDERWDPIDGTSIDTSSVYRNSIDLDTHGDWGNDGFTVGKVGQSVSIFDGRSSIPDGATVHIAFSLPEEVDSDDEVLADGTGIVRLSLDNVKLYNDFTNDEVSPVFERVRDDLTSHETIHYNPIFYGHEDSSDGVRQKLPDTEFWESGDDKASVDSRSLHEIVTQQKINDYQSEFKYYSGTLIPIGDRPLTPIDKILIDYEEYSESESAILDYGRYDLKSNRYDISMVVPNQGTDLTSTFHTNNINLVAAPFAGKSASTYILQIELNEVKDASDNDVTDGLTAAPKRFIRIEGRPGDVITKEIRLEPATGYVGNAADTAVTPDSTTTPRPTYADFRDGAFSYNQGDLVLQVEITLPSTPEFETLYIDGAVVEFTPESTPGVVSGTLTVTNDVSNSSPSSETISLDGVPGSTIQVEFIMEGNDDDDDSVPDWTFQNLDATDTDSDLTFVQAVGNGTSTGIIKWEYEIPTTGENITATVSGSTVAATTSASDIKTRNLKITLPSNINCLDGTTTGSVATIPFVGTVGQEIVRNLSFEYDSDGTDVKSVSFSSATNFATDGEQKRDGDRLEVPVKVTIAGDTSTLDITTTATVTTEVEPFSVTFNVNAQNVINAEVGIEDNSGSNQIKFAYSQDDIDNSDSIDSFVVFCKPIEGYQFADNGDADLDILEAAVAVVDSDGTTVSFDESQFTAAKQSLGTDGEIRWQIDGNFPSPGSNYLVQINVVGAGREGVAMANEKPAETVTVTSLGPTIPAQGGTALFQVDTDGEVDLSIEVSYNTSDTDPASTTNSSGTFSETFSYTTGAGSLDLDFGGSYSPTTATSGVRTVTLDADEIPMASGVSTTTNGPVILYATSVTYTLRAHPKGSTTVLDSASVTQDSAKGGRTVTIETNSSTTDAQITSSGNFISGEFPTWTFNY